MLPTFSSPAIAIRMGKAAEKIGRSACRYDSSCFAPPASIVTVSMESAPKTPVASKRPTSESREKKKDSITSAGLSETLDRTTADPV